MTSRVHEVPFGFLFATRAHRPCSLQVDHGRQEADGRFRALTQSRVIGQDVPELVERGERAEVPDEERRGAERLVTDAGRLRVEERRVVGSAQ